MGGCVVAIGGERGGMQRINRQMNKYKKGGRGLLDKCSGHPIIVHIRRVSRIKRVRTNKMQESE